jgi:hypothetical protein
MKLEKALVYGGIGYLAYLAFFKPKAASKAQSMDAGAPILSSSPENLVGADGKYHFRYMGSSALRVDPVSGQAINCGTPGEPFSSSGIEGHFAKSGVAPTTYYAVLQLGSKRAIMEGDLQPNANKTPQGPIVKPGDKLQLSVTGGQFSALDGQVVTVLQLGTDACTQSGVPEMMNSAVVVDLPIILEGAGDYQYPAQDAIGYALPV